LPYSGQGVHKEMDGEEWGLTSLSCN
jgi:hypothetical protein